MNIKLFKCLLAIILFLTISANLYAQKSSTFRSIGTEEGLSNAFVTTFYKDSTGFMWVGTDIGLNRFDGVSIQSYYCSEKEITKNSITTIVEWNNQIVLATDLGLMRLNKENKSLQFIKPESINTKINKLVVDPRTNTLFAGSGEGLFILNQNDSVEKIQLDPNVLSQGNIILSMVSDGNGGIWIATKRGLFNYNQINKRTQKFEFVRDNLELNSFNSITKVGNSIILGTFSAGLVEFNIATRKFSKFADVDINIINDLSSDGKDIIYVSGYGINFISLKSRTVIKSYTYNSHQNSDLRSNSISTLLLDRDGILWICYYKLGFDYSLFQNELFNCYSFPPYFDSKNLNVRTFLIEGNEKLIGTNEGLFYINENKRIVKKYDYSDLRSNTIIAICFFKGEYYIGTYGGGASVLNPKTGKIRPLASDRVLLTRHVFDFREDNQGKLWIATSEGVYKFDKEKNTFQFFDSKNSKLKEGNVYFIHFDYLNRGWFATGTGLSLLDPTTQNFRSNIFSQNFNNDQLFRAVYEDGNHNMYFCPEGGNIIESDIDLLKFSEFELTKKYKSRIFTSVLQDSKGRYWIATDNGLLMFDETKKENHVFGFLDGIPDQSFAINAAYEDASGKLWFGNTKGLIFIEPSQINKLKHRKYPVIVTNLKINGKALNSERQNDFAAKKRISCKYDENNLSFQYVSLTYSDPGKQVYEYMLEGYEADWKQQTGINEISYYGLSSGNYILHLRILDDPSSETLYEVKVKSFFSLWFYLILIFSGGLLYFGFEIVKKYVDKKANFIVAQNALISAAKRIRRATSREIHPSNIDCEKMLESLRNNMETNKLYTNPDLNLTDLAYLTRIPTKTLTYILNHYLNTNYSDFINEYRINAFKVIVADNTSVKFTLNALSEQCGFGSRAAFYRIFKKHCGITPNEYIRSVDMQLLVTDLDDK